MNEKLGFKDLFNIYVFTEDGKYITELNTINEFQLIGQRLAIKDALFNMDLMRFLLDNKEETTDYDMFLKKISPKEIVFSKKKKYKKVKLVALGKTRNLNGEDIDCVLNMPNVEMYYSNNMSLDGSNPFKVVIEFEIKEYNEDGDLYGMKFYV